MKRFALIILITAVLALAACAPPPTVSTPIGEFECKQEAMTGIEDDQGNSLDAAEGNILLVVYMTPAKDNAVTEDQAYAYFLNGVQAVVAGQAYDLECISFEKVSGKLRYGLVFEVVDDGYEDKLPDYTLNLPASMPEATPAPTAAPTVAPAQSAEPVETTNANPTESTAASS